MNRPRYDVYSAPASDPDTKTFFFQAPLGSLPALLGTHPSALKRVESELNGLAFDESTLHQNGKGRFPNLVFFVRQAGF